MKNKITIAFALLIIALSSISLRSNEEATPYFSLYHERFENFNERQEVLLKYIKDSDLSSRNDLSIVRKQIDNARMALKRMDFWFRYFEPVSYKKINGPLPVEWETEVFEKFEKPYRREGAGLTLAALYLEEEDVKRDSLLYLIQASVNTAALFGSDSVTAKLKNHDHFYLCNRLFLLNLAAIYTTGFECPDTSRIIPELRGMLAGVRDIYSAFNESFPDVNLSAEYLNRYEGLIKFVNRQSSGYSRFDHFTFIRDYVNPLFALNQQMINHFQISSRSYVDYSLNKTATSIFSKGLYAGQNPKGLFLRVKDENVLAEIEKLGKMLFYDPILSGNNLRSCASCHNPTQYFTDTVATASAHFNRIDFLERNSPSLINVEYNHLMMADGKHTSMQDQAKAVICNPAEMGSREEEVLEKIKSCPEYEKAFRKLLKYTPQEKEISFDHIASAITFYYSRFSKFYSPFDRSMNENKNIELPVQEGFNLFMGKAQCATCHFVPEFNGVKPPYTNSEFEVLGVPEDPAHKNLSNDKGRYGINPAEETMNAFRTGSVRNAEFTKPYMHNGVFTSLEQVIDFYNGGGGAGHGLTVSNQTLSSDSLHLTHADKKNLISFIRSLNEDIEFETPPASLPESKNKILNKRKVGGEY
ncbi:MAG: cytochrome-c peroxidase [Cytophagaceae bacterium]